MATFSIKIFRHHKKKDGTYNVKICITHERRRTYMDTNHYVTDKKLSKKLEVKDPLVLRDLYITLENYREAISRLGVKVDYMDVEAIKDFLEKKSQKTDFLAFCQQHIDKLMSDGRDKTATGFRTVRYALLDFVGSERLSADEVTPNFLMAFERFLRSPRQLKRINRLGREVIIKSKGSTDAGVHNYMHDLRTLFNAACAFYNRPSLGIIAIPFNPFKEYKLPELAETRKRNLTLEQVASFIAYDAPEKGRVRLVYNLFLLSFYMCGMNAIDLYSSGLIIQNGRLEYQRSKTKGKRKDRAFISIRVPETALPLLDTYRDKLEKEYSNVGNLNKALNKGLKVIGEAIGVPDLSFYWARHTFGNLARNKCRKSKDDVALALNHVDHGRRTTDIYLEKDWKIVDEVQDAVIGLLTLKNTCRPTPVSNIFQTINLPLLDAKQHNMDVTNNPIEQPHANCTEFDQQRRSMRIVISGT